MIKNYLSSIILLFTLTCIHAQVDDYDNEEDSEKRHWDLRFTTNFSRQTVKGSLGPVKLDTDPSAGVAFCVFRHYKLDDQLSIKAGAGILFQRFNWKFYAEKELFKIPYGVEHRDAFHRIAYSFPVLLKWQKRNAKNKILFLETGLNLKYFRQRLFGTEVSVYDDTTKVSHTIFVMDLFPNRIKTFIILELNAGLEIWKKDNKSLEAIVHFNFGPPPFDSVLSGTYNFYSAGKLISTGEYSVTPHLLGFGLQFAY